MQEIDNIDQLTGKVTIKKSRVVVSRAKRKILRHVWIVRSIVLALAVLAVYVLVILSGSLMRGLGVDYYTGLASDFIFTPKEKIKIIDERTNILILGKGGEGHDAPELTDTIIFASVLHPKSSSVFENSEVSITLISLSRDIWLPDLRAKLNSAYYWGNEKKPPVQGPSGLEEGGGLVLAKSVVEEVVGLPVSYVVVIDFSSFQEVVDILGGIEVDVETAFTDEKYPIAGRENDECDGDMEYKCRYETIAFEKGIQTMDGEIALKFVRSRNAEGDEGTDFARAARQQKVIAAIKNKVLSREVLLSPEKLKNLSNVAFEHLETDMDMSVLTILARRALQAKDNIRSSVLPEELLVNPPISPKFDNLYVFIPKDEDWSGVHEWVGCVLEGRVCN